VVFFNQAWRERQLLLGVQALFSRQGHRLPRPAQMTNPVVDVIVGATGEERDASRVGRVVAIYPASGKAGLTSWEMGRIRRRIAATGRPTARPGARIRCGRRSTGGPHDLPTGHPLARRNGRRGAGPTAAGLRRVLALTAAAGPSASPARRECPPGSAHPLNVDDLDVAPGALTTPTSSPGSTFLAGHRSP